MSEWLSIKNIISQSHIKNCIVILLLNDKGRNKIVSEFWILQRLLCVWMSVSCVTIFLISILSYSVLFNNMEENIDFHFVFCQKRCQSVKCEGVRKEMQSVTGALSCWIRRQRSVNCEFLKRLVVYGTAAETLLSSS